MTTFRAALQQFNINGANQAPEAWPPTFGGVVGWLVDLGYTDNLLGWGRAIEGLRPAQTSVMSQSASQLPSPTSARVPVTLNPAQMQQMLEAILSAFRPGDMKTLSLFGMGTDWEEIVSPGSFRDQVFEFIRWLLSNHKVEEFVVKAREENSGNLLLKAFAESIGVTNQIY